ncbi:hypothetical protein [Novosphingobium resinovorum]|uniref:hypothetical protein n=1 Tax=Novosphingobium resinovorum TaxID=158500 RepID=UPI0009F4A91D|nr:hypothetical protein [Novosphingobium resinovorum]
MIGKIIGAIAGQRVSRDVGGVGGTGGALLGVGAATVLRRLGPVGMVAAAAGGYALKKHLEKREIRRLR